MKTENSFSFKSALVALFMLISATAMAQTTVTGNVRDDAGEPIIGATVREVGTQNATVTDFDGNFSVKVSNENATLSISYVGFQTQEVKLAGRKTVSLSLKSDDELLDEVVVVGYGVQKKKLVTGATVQVKGEEIAKMNTSNALTAMQSTTPGVQITQASSQPGKGFKVSIRGVGTIGTSSPLLIIDGVNSGTADDGLNGLNPNDIESIDVLKDAASAAIYGARAANGVILVTTKQGKAGSLQVSYDGFYGISNAYRRPSTLNAREYMQVVNESRFNTYGTTTDWSQFVPQAVIDKVNNGWEGTDWFDLYQNKNAQQHSHAVTIAGGSDRSKFSMSLNFSNQEGIMGGENASDFRRYGGRINSDHVLYRTDSGRDVVTVGENVSYWFHSSHDLAEASGYWNIMKPTYTTSPLVPVYADEEAGILANPQNSPGYISTMFINPYAGFLGGQYSSINRSRNFGVGATFYVVVEPIKGLKYRGQINTGYNGYNHREMGLPFSASFNQSSSSYSVSMNSSQGSSLVMDNTLSYEFQKLGKHHLDLLVGQSFEQSNWSFGLSGNASAPEASVNSLVTKGWDYAMLNNFDFAQWGGGSGYAYPLQGSLASFFGRVNWNYDEKYMATVTLRADGSSNFARGHRWGYFPSASVGWDISREAFMASASSWLDQLKLRASWGQNGNQAIPGFTYLSNIAFSPSNYPDYGYKFDSSIPGSVTLNNYVTGAYSENVPNPDVKWETSEQLNIGLDARFLSSRLGVNIDWYKKTTKDWLVDGPMNSVLGYEKPAKINGGDVQNTGLEVALSWNDNIGKDFRYHVGVNGAYNKNEVTRLETFRIGDDVTDALFENSSYVSLVEKGHPIGYFSGMSHSGIWQNSAQIEAARAAGKAVLPNAQPGDCIWDDFNGDGQISFEEDRHEIGDPHPDVTLGFNLGFEWKGLDFSVSGSGAFGMQIMQCFRTDLLANGFTNYTRDIFNRWHGEGTSNTLPRLTIGGENWGWVSDVYMQNADYLKIQNITLGYDLARIWKNKLFTQFRVYGQAQNLITFTGYTGVDPECSSNGGNGDGNWVRGVDVGLYPTARTFLVGVSIKFADKTKKKAAPVYTQAEPQYIEKIVEKVVEKPVVKVEKETELVQNTYVVTFEVNSYQISNTAELAGLEKGSNVEVVAYASPEGNAEANKTLSQKRADAVADYLKSKGVNVTRVVAKGADSQHANRIAIVTVK